MPSGLTGAMSLTLNNAKTTLAKAVAFQTLMNASSAAEAEGHIAKWTQREDRLPRPYVLMRWVPGARRVWVAQGTSGQEYEPWVDGVIKIRFVQEVGKSLVDNPEVAFEGFFDAVEAAMEGMKDIAGIGSNLMFSSYVLADEPDVFLAEEGEFYGFAVEFDITVGAGV